MAAIGRLSKSHRRADPSGGRQKGGEGDPSLKRGKGVEAKGEKNPHATNIPLPLFPPIPLFPLEKASGLAAQSVGELFCSAV